MWIIISYYRFCPCAAFPFFFSSRSRVQKYLEVDLAVYFFWVTSWPFGKKATTKLIRKSNQIFLTSEASGGFGKSLAGTGDPVLHVRVAVFVLSPELTQAK